MERFELSRAFRPLPLFESGPFNHLGTSPCIFFNRLPKTGENLNDFDVNGNGKPIGNQYFFEIVFSPRQHVFESCILNEPLKIITLLGGFFYRSRFELPRFSRRPGENKALGENYRREQEKIFDFNVLKPRQIKGFVRTKPPKLRRISSADPSASWVHLLIQLAYFNKSKHLCQGI
mgnify:CR=1 FL=1